MRCIKKLPGTITMRNKKGKNVRTGRLGLYRCPVCEKLVILPQNRGSTAKTCGSEECKQVRSNPNLCFEVCTVCDCEWLLKGEPVKGWTAHKILYDGAEHEMHKYTYRVKACPKFKRGKVYFSENDLFNLQKRTNKT